MAHIKTQKLLKGLAALKMDFEPDYPSISVYGKLAERGYSWDGSEWTKKGGPELYYPVLLRCTGDLRDITMLNDIIADFLRKQGYHVVLKTPVPNHQDRNFRQYIEVE